MRKTITLSLDAGKKGMTAFQTIEEGNRLRAVVAPFKQLQGRVLTDTYWSGTLVAYSNGKLGKYVEYRDPGKDRTYIFEVPPDAVGESGVCLAINHGFQKNGKPLIIPRRENDKRIFEIADKGQVKIIPGFPSAQGRYKTEPEFGITVGMPVLQPTPGSHELLRIPVYVGLIPAVHIDSACVNLQVPSWFEFGALGSKLDFVDIAKGHLVNAKESVLSAVKEGISFVRECVKQY